MSEFSKNLKQGLGFMRELEETHRLQQVDPRAAIQAKLRENFKSGWSQAFGEAKPEGFSYLNHMLNLPQKTKGKK